jgi:phage/plasmid-associated DNA primase
MLREEGPGIMAWCVAGAKDYLANGLRVPPKVADASEAYRRVEDVNGSFPFPAFFEHE